MSDTAEIDVIKRFVNRHFERLLVIVLVGALLFIQQAVEYKMAFLSFYYLPIIAAGFLVGRRMAVWAALFVVLLVGFLQTFQGFVARPGLHAESLSYLIPWGGFLILTGYAVGALAEQRRARTNDVRATYLAMLELLSLHVDASDRMRRGHSYRVGERAALLARELGVDETRQEDLRIAGLLHEIGPRDPRLLRAIAALPGGGHGDSASIRAALHLVEEYSHYHEGVGSGAS
ncbi:MAG TPA: HD domain-containing protein, partial [Gemmatimonadaceae bacterium]|nr:HD domain-containing protein [Gemmatimonadaceae bacterium]